MIALVISLIVVGVLLWAATTYIPMDPGIKKILVGVVVFAVLLYVLWFFGALAYVDRPFRRHL